MFLRSEYVENHYSRPSKLGNTHTYIRKKTLAVFRCDSCGTEFKREKGSIDPKRLNNNFYHVCSNCDAKRFAQEKGVEKRCIWNLPVSSLKTLDRL
jgi:hypothetical protein